MMRELQAAARRAVLSAADLPEDSLVRLAPADRTGIVEPLTARALVAKEARPVLRPAMVAGAGRPLFATKVTKRRPRRLAALHRPVRDCPAERECYSLDDGCGPILCAVPAGVHCDDPLSVCDPGDTLATLGECEGYPSPCYSKRLCTRSTVCRHVTDAGVDAGIDGA